MGKLVLVWLVALLIVAAFAVPALGHQDDSGCHLGRPAAAGGSALAETFWHVPGENWFDGKAFAEVNREIAQAGEKGDIQVAARATCRD